MSRDEGALYADSEGEVDRLPDIDGVCEKPPDPTALLFSRALGGMREEDAALDGYDSSNVSSSPSAPSSREYRGSGIVACKAVRSTDALVTVD